MLEAGSAALELRRSAPDETALVIAAAPAADIRRPLLSAFEAILASEPERQPLILDLTGREDLADWLARKGVAEDVGGGRRAVRPEMFWQLPDPWLSGPENALFPLSHRMTDGKRHPLRPPKPKGVAYSRFIPWLGQVLSFRAATVAEDLDRLHRWMNDPRVAAVWEESGSLEEHRAYLSRLIADPHMIPLIASLDDVAFGYFEIYWAKENRLGPFYDADDYDRGWHVLIGEEACRGRDYVTAWLPSLMHYLFLDDPRTRRIVGEPRADHHQQIRNLERSGFAKIKHFDFPHKRAVLVSLLRERFFNDRLWAPAT